MHRVLVGCVVLVASGATILQAQSAVRPVSVATSRSDEPRFASEVDLVALDVCVKDRSGRPTTGLERQDFLILENNTPQQVTLFAPAGRVPLAVALVIDTSQSMSGGRLDRAKVAAEQFVDLLRPDDLVEVLSFNDRANLEYDLGLNHDQAKRSLRDLSAAGMTRLYEAVLVALRNLEHAQRHRTADSLSVMIVLSDGDDTGSGVAFEDLSEQVRRSGVLTYTISLLDKGDRMVAPRWQMAALARDSGGASVAVRDLSGLVGIYQDINAELVSLYRIGYVPASVARDGGWRTISVRVPEHALVIRTRAGYYAPRSHPSSSRKPLR
jgi:Ca-activated chloride channel homolog